MSFYFVEVLMICRPYPQVCFVNSKSLFDKRSSGIYCILNHFIDVESRRFSTLNTFAEAFKFFLTVVCAPFSARLSQCFACH
jgi:hypothetical protein